MSQSRRTFLRNSCLGLSAMAMSAGFERFGLLNSVVAQAQNDYKALVCIFLYGGNDGNNTVIPYEQTRYSQYNTGRGSLALARESLSSTVIRPRSLGYDFAFHPAMTGFHSLWQQNKLAVLCNMGTLIEHTTKAQIQNGTANLPELLFSHQDQQKQWQTFPGRRSNAGWGARIADRLRHRNTGNFPMILSFSGDELFVTSAQTEFLPLILDPGEGFTLLGFEDGTPESLARKAALREALLVDREHPLIDGISRISKQALDSEQLLNDALRQVSVNTPFPETGLGLQLKQIAHIIAARNILGHKRQLFFCSIGGFDTHGIQLYRQEQQLIELDAATKAFYDSTVELQLQDKVMSFTLSDFGRTLKPAGTGTDHAWGNHLFAIGGAVRGGDFYGAFPNLDVNGNDSLDEDGRWIPTMSVDQYAVTIARWYGVAMADLPYVAPNFRRFDRPPNFML